MMHGPAEVEGKRTTITRMFEPADPTAVPNKATCPHPWDSIHYPEKEVCPRCTAVLKIRARRVWVEDPWPLEPVV